MKDAVTGAPVPAGTTVLVRAKSPWVAALDSAFHTAYPVFGGLMLLAYMMAGAMHVDGCAGQDCSSAAMNSTPQLWLTWWGFIHPTSPKEPTGFWWPFLWTQVLIPAWRGLNTGSASNRQVAAPLPEGVKL